MNNKKGKEPKIVISIIAIILLVTCGYLVTKKTSMKGEGHIIVEVIDLNGSKIKEKEYIKYSFRLYFPRKYYPIIRFINTCFTKCFHYYIR